MSTNTEDKRAERAVFERAVHDLKNPLAVVRASLEWLEVELAGREDVLDAVQDASMASDRLLTIVDDLDSLARLGDADLPLASHVAVTAIAHRVAERASVRLSRSRVTVQVVSAGDVELTGDPRLIERSLSALVDATARGAPGGACIELTVSRVVRASGPFVEMSVALRGSAERPGPPVTLDPLDASGLGVYAAQRIARAHRGSLVVVATTLLPRIVLSIPV
ncbi:MAG: Sensor protein [Labilithrix sp.]|nr:Sensor protein [Labilithrix sp.]